jgi:hypothetical protein
LCDRGYARRHEGLFGEESGEICGKVAEERNEEKKEKKEKEEKEEKR